MHIFMYVEIVGHLFRNKSSTISTCYFVNTIAQLKLDLLLPFHYYDYYY